MYFVLITREEGGKSLKMFIKTRFHNKVTSLSSIARSIVRGFYASGQSFEGILLDLINAAVKDACLTLRAEIIFFFKSLDLMCSSWSQFSSAGFLKVKSAVVFFLSLHYM